VERAIRERDPQDLRLLRVEAPPEIHTLLAAINDFMGRLDARISLMSRIIGDAALQIRTPLTVLAAQLDLLGAEPATERREERVQRLQQRTQQPGHLSIRCLTTP
jgi:two-component system sensor histidine kinase TctE